LKVTIRDIAEKANVSIATVSRVINNKSEGVGEETRKRILKLVKELGYQPNALARGLVTKKTKTVGLIIPDITNPFFADIARGVEDQANLFGYNVFLCNTDDDLDKENKYINALKEKYVDGIIFTSSSIPNQNHIVELIKTGIPTILMDRQIDDKHVVGIFIDNLLGGYIATKHLLELGYSRIACITGPLFLKSAVERLQGYEKALNEYGMEVDNEIVAEGTYKMESGYETAKELLAKGVRTFFVCNDIMALGVCKAVKESGYNIPEDVSVVGFDDIQISHVIEPPLTTVRQPSYDMGKEAIKMLVKLIEGKKIRKKIVKFKPELVIRQSTKAI